MKDNEGSQRRAHMYLTDLHYFTYFKNIIYNFPVIKADLNLMTEKTYCIQGITEQSTSSHIIVQLLNAKETESLDVCRVGQTLKKIQ